MKLVTEALGDGEALLVGVPLQHIDAANTRDFRAAVDPLLSAYRIVVLDLGEVEFIDSSGLGALLACLRTMNGKGGELRLCGLRKPVLALFELVRMHRLFAIYDDRDAALASL
jgi:anti-sigma B factor antagonist